MSIYNKLVRDKIPQVIEKTNTKFSTRTLSKQEYIEEVKKKMNEELEEYQEATSNEDAVEELADLLELVYAALHIHGTTIEQLEEVRRAKAEKRGGFEKRIFLIEIEHANDEVERECRRKSNTF